VVGQAFQFQGQGAQGLGPRGNRKARQGFHDRAGGDGVGDGCITGDGARQVQEDGAQGRPLQGRLHAPVLVAQGDLQVQHLLAQHLEAEVPGLDHPGVHGPHGHLVDALALHPVEGRVLRTPAHGARPGVIQGRHAGLLGHLPFEELDLGAGPGQAGETLRRQHRAQGPELPRPVIGQDQQLLPAIGRPAQNLPRAGEQGHDAASPADRVQQGVTETVRVQQGDVPVAQCLAVGE
jgi:hypothetical protein